MKKNYFLTVLFSLAMLSLNAQFVDDFEDCTGNGIPISIGHWTDWGCGGGAGCAIVCSDDQAHSGTYSGLIPDDGTTDAVLDLGNKIFGEWTLEFWMYVPSNKEAYWNLQGTVPIGAGEWIVGNVFFNQDNANPGVGLMDNSALGPVNFNFPHDQWFKIKMNWDITSGISLATWEFEVDGVVVLPSGTPFTDGSGTIPTSLGGMDFFSISTDNWYYLDDMCFIEGGGNCNLGSEDHTELSFNLYPNPVKDRLIVENNSSIDINSIKIYDLLGRIVLIEEINFDQIELSHLNSGVLFVEIKTDRGVFTKKIIKE